MKDYYKILGLTSKASKSEVIGAFRVLAKKWHPDINRSNQASQVFREVYEAYEILKDDKKRLAYDALLDAERNSHQKANASFSQGSAYSQTSQSGNYAYQSWQREAQDKASYYASKSYNTFFKEILKSTAKVASAVGEGILAIVFGIIIYILSIIANIIEFAFVFAMTIGLPFITFSFSPIWGSVSVILILISGFYYRKIVKEYERFWLFLISGYNKKPFVLLLIFMVAYAGSSTIFIVNYNQNKREVAKLAKENEVKDFNRNMNTYDKTYPIHLSNKAVVSGLILPVDLPNDEAGLPKVDTMFYSMSNSTKPRRASDVKNVFRISRDEVEIGRYSNGGSATQIVYSVELVDLNKGVITVKKEFKGSMPASYIRTSRNSSYGSSGSDPIQEVRELFKKLSGNTISSTK